jgi:hypothetical protein
MRKNSGMEEREEFHRVWNFVVPLNKMDYNRSIQSIPPLNKDSSATTRKTKKKTAS